MKTLSCKDLGAKDCDYVSKGFASAEVIDDMINHAKKDHLEEMKKMQSEMSEGEMENMIRSKIKDEA